MYISLYIENTEQSMLLVIIFILMHVIFTAFIYVTPVKMLGNAADSIVPERRK